MLKKILIAILGITVLGAGGGALVYQAARQTNNQATAAAETPASEQGAVTGQGQHQYGQTAQVQTSASAGEPWTATGTIVLVEEYGIMLALPDGSEVYVELGPPDAWQSQGVVLAVGDTVTVEGFASDAGYHAGVVTTGSGEQILLRTSAGQPTWSGGAGHGADGTAGQESGLTDGEHVPQPQVVVDEWITLEGEIATITQNMLTMITTDGETIDLQLGRPSFIASQGVTFAAGDTISVLGFYQGTTFNAGEITQQSTGLTVMLRDPNGRPLWGGPGSGAQGSGAGQSGGNGRGYQGGR